jgi:CheY-like chemotaxis protein
MPRTVFCETSGNGAVFPGDEAPAAGGSVFLVDDDPRIGEEFSAAFSARGWPVEVFDRGADLLAGLARTLARGLRPILLVDLVMPRLNGEGILGGLELLRLIRSRYPDLTVRMFSDYFCAETEKEVQALGGGKLLLKPHRRQIAEGDDGALSAFIEQVAAVLPPPEQKVVRAAEKVRVSEVDGELPGAAGRSASEDAPVLHQLQLLKTLTTELRAHDLGEQIWLLVLRFAAELFDRAVIFSVAGSMLRGVGQFGFEGFGRIQGGRLREKLLSPSGTGLFDPVLQSRSPLVKRLVSEDWNRTFGEWPGGPPAEEIFLGPIVCHDQVVAILYGDTSFRGRAIGEATALEVFLAEAGLVMERISGNAHCSSP